jgi:hypothetical protein
VAGALLGGRESSLGGGNGCLEGRGEGRVHHVEDHFRKDSLGDGGGREGLLSFGVGKMRGTMDVGGEEGRSGGAAGLNANPCKKIDRSMES